MKVTKRTTRKLSLGLETVRSLGTPELAVAVGALATYAWTVCLGCAQPTPTGGCTLAPCFPATRYTCLC